jgi:K(+)-stimulated pyrophosphate-energized sodium pump
MDLIVSYLTSEKGAMLGIGISVVSLIYAFYLNGWIKKQSPGTERMQELAGFVQQGAMAFLKTEYKMLGMFAGCVAIALYFGVEDNGATAISYVVGALASGVAGWIGMRTATMSAVRTTEAAKSGLTGALTVAFRSGAVMGLTVVGLGLMGVSILFNYWHGNTAIGENFIKPLFGFSFGASSIALFARVGGGIFTKAADVGADLVGKVEAGIPEDDPRNPATIADNVGDNVGDVAGMGADLFESYVGSVIACMALGLTAFGVANVDASMPWVALPLVLCGLGTLSSIIGIAVVKTKDERKVHSALFNGLLMASVIFAGLAFFVFTQLPDTAHHIADGATKWGIYGTLVGGLLLGIIIGKICDVFG